MIRLERIKTWFLIAVLTICGTASFASCSSNEANATEQNNIANIADLFPENDLQGAIQFGKENGQYSIFILSTYTEIPVRGKVAEILERGTILFGTTGDYRPLSFCEPDGTY